MKKLLSTTIVLGLIFTAPGLMPYHAFANVVGSASKGVSVNAGANAVGAGAVHISASVTATNLNFGVSAMPLLSGTLPSLVNPAANSAVSASVLPQTSANVAVSAAATHVSPAASFIKSGAALRKTASLNRDAENVSVSPLKNVAGTVREIESGKVSKSLSLRRLFDFGSRRSAANLSPTVAVLGRNVANRSGLSRPGAKVSAKGLSAPEGAPSFRPDENPESLKDRQPSLWVVLPLAVVGGAAGFYAMPFAFPMLAALFPSLALISPFWAAAAFTGAGSLAGLAASQYGIWQSWPREVLDGAKNAAVSTFKFWARFGRIFDSVLTGRSSDDAMKAPLPLNIFKYPILAWPFVLVGYGAVPAILAVGFLYLQWPVLSVLYIAGGLIFGGAPVSAAAGFLYKVVSTPIVAAWRGFKQVLLQFFPWLVDVIRFIKRMIMKAVPFVLGFLWGGIRAGGIGMGVGAITLARPVFEKVVAADYEAVDEYNDQPLVERFHEYVGVRLLQIAGLIAAVVTGVTGAVLGLVMSVPYIFTHAWDTAFEKAEVRGRLPRALRRWRDNLEKYEDAIGEASQIDFGKDGEAKNIGLRDGVTRLINTVGHAVYQIPTVMGTYLAAYVRSWYYVFHPRSESEAVKDDYSPAAAPSAENASGTAGKENGKPAGFAIPLILGTLATAGAVAAFHLYALPLLAFSSIFWLAGAYAGAGLAGLGAGFALSQPSEWMTAFAGVPAAAKKSAAGAFRSWARLGLRAQAALTGREEADRKLYAETPTSLGSYPLLAMPGVFIGYIASGVSYLAGGLAKTISAPLEAAWKGAVILLTSGFIKRIIKAIGRFIRGFVPFVFGFVWGAFKGLFFTAVVGGAILAKPVAELAVAPEDPGYEAKTMPAMFAVRFVQLGAIIVTVVSAVIGGVLGLALGIPSTLMWAMRQGTKWGDYDGRFGNFFKIWEKETMRQEGDLLERLAEPSFPAPAKTLTYWDGVVRTGNLFTSAKAATIWLPFVAVAVQARSIWRAAVAAFKRDPNKSAREVSEELSQSLRDVPGEDEVVSNEAATEEIDGMTSPVRPEIAPKGFVVPTVLGILGTAAGVAGLMFYGAPVLGLLSSTWMVWGAYGASGLLGLGAGLALSQPRAFAGWWSSIAGNARNSGLSTIGYWSSAGRRFAGALMGRTASQKNILGWPHLAVGAFLSIIPWTLLGAVYGFAVVPARAALLGARAVIEQFLPWLKRVWAALTRIAKRFFPFIGGAIAGFFLGVIGAATFGALLLGRPWFKHIVAEDVEYDSFGRMIGIFVLKLVATVAGVVFGVLGLAFGVLAAAPYALTLIVSTAFQLGEIGGKSQKFFDLWSKGTLRTEMRRLNQLTDKFEFNEKRNNGRITLVDAWIRMANILPATLVATIVTTIAGYVSYVRSIWNAAADLRAGKEVGDEADYDDLDGAFDTARYASKNGSKWLSRLAAWGGGLYALYLVASSIFGSGALWASIWHGFLYATLGWPVGWLTGLIAGGVIGFGVGLVIWMARQFDKKPGK